MNIEDHNYIIIKVDGEGILVSKSTFLHNKKVSSSKTAENKKQGKNANNPQGMHISQLDMLHVILKYPELITNLDLIKLNSIP